MPVYLKEASFVALDAATLEAWRGIPSAVASDCMNRAQTLAAAIKPLAAGMRLVAQARTVACMVGDNSAIHAALRLLRPGEALAVAAGGYADTAVWGGLMTQAAIARGCAGIVVDGAVRDAAEIRQSGFPCFAAANVPAGPHQGFGGTIDGPVSCGGCGIAPGDLLLGDDDGVAVVPLARQETLLAAAREKIAQEEGALERLRAGESLADQFGLPDPEPLD